MAPRARREQLRVREMGDRLALLDERDGRVHLLDPIASALWELADGTVSVQDLTISIARRQGESVTAEAVERGVADLEAAGLLVHEASTLARRSVLAAAVLGPTVLTLGAAAPAAAAAQIAICHNGMTIMVSAKSVASHLAHGDTLGACGDVTTTAAPTTLPPTTTTTTLPPTTTTTTLPPTTTTTTLPPTTTTTTLAPTTTMRPL